ncbi:MAG: DNA repair protein RecN [Blastocatellia bacterium]|nr:DNA repair protein RecN [Blastocatellia bacterium]MBN8725714.1 DNA repair protein RecN [Acidobacteriota bacterium]
MLKSLNISNLAVVTKLQVEFGNGLNLLTGETGSGKSIIVDALGLLLGGRTSAEMIRSGQQKAHVEGVFQVVAHKELFQTVESAGIEIDSKEIVIRRELTTSGRSRAFVNDQLTTVAFLRELRPYLVDIHGQNEQQTLLYAESHLDLLDLFAGLEKDCEEIRNKYRYWQSLEKELAELRRSEAERLRMLDMLEFQSSEIERANLEIGEDQQLQDERRLLVNGEKLTASSVHCYEMLYESEAAILSQVASLAKKMDELASLDPRFGQYIESVQTARYGLEDLAYFLRDYIDRVNFSPERLKEVEDRLIEIDKLKRKYGNSIEAILSSAEEMREKLLRLHTSELQEQRLVKSIAEAQTSYWEIAKDLSKRRRKVARDLEIAVMEELKHLAMERTQFQMGFLGNEIRATERGMDNVEMLVSTNVGEEFRPLVKIASGGEISRLMLALKTITAPTEYPRTLVFDEVDVGIGGRVAEAVGQRLKRLATTNQVLCVTHQAQIARFADIHYSVEKRVIAGRTEVSVEKLDQVGRVEELARMIGGSQITDLTRQHANELLVKG